MATFSKIAFQPTTMTTGTGRMTKVAATATAGTTIHTVANVATTVDEIWLYAMNNDTVDRELTIEFGGVSSPDDLIRFTVPTKDGLYLVVAGLVLQGNTTPVVVRAFCAAAANVISIGGYVNRITA